MNQLTLPYYLGLTKVQSFPYCAIIISSKIKLGRSRFVVKRPSLSNEIAYPTLLSWSYQGLRLSLHKVLIDVIGGKNTFIRPSSSNKLCYPPMLTLPSLSNELAYCTQVLGLCKDQGLFTYSTVTLTPCSTVALPHYHDVSFFKSNPILTSICCLHVLLTNKAFYLDKISHGTLAKREGSVQLTSSLRQLVL